MPRASLSRRSSLACGPDHTQLGPEPPRGILEFPLSSGLTLRVIHQLPRETVSLIDPDRRCTCIGAAKRDTLAADGYVIRDIGSQVVLTVEGPFWDLWGLRFCSPPAISHW